MTDFSSRVQPGEDKRSEFMKPRRRSSLSGPLTFFILIIAMIFVMSVIFRVSTITVNGNTHYSDQDIINAIEIEQGDNLFFFDRFAAVSRVFAKLPYVEEVTVTRNLPDKVIIDVTETTAIAYFKLGTELWTLDHNCKILGKAAEGEEAGLIPITGFKPGTLLINERLTSEDGSGRNVDFLEEIFHQIEGRSILTYITKIDFSDPNNVKLFYGGKYTINLGDPYSPEHKFSLVVSAISQLKDGDIGILDVSDAKTVHFKPY